MPTDPLTGTDYPASNYAPNIAQFFQDVVLGLADNTIPRFATTTERDTAYTAHVAAGGVMEDGMVCFVGGLFYERAGGVWTSRPGLKPQGLLHGTTTQSIPNDTYTVVNLNTQVRAVGLTTTTASGRITATLAGIYLVSGAVTFNAATGRRFVAIYKNGVIIPQAQNRADPSGSGLGLASVATPAYPVSLNSGEYVQVAAYQDSGGAVTVDRTQSFLQAHWIAPQ